MNKSTIMFIITLTFLMLVGLTVISATDIDNYDTTEITDTIEVNTPGTTTQTSTLADDTTSTNEASLNQTDNIQDAINSQETINDKTGEKTQNLKASITETVTNYAQLNSYLRNNTYDTVTINIDNDIQLEGNIVVNNIIKTLTINGNSKTIDGNNKYTFLYFNQPVNVTIQDLTITKCNSTGNGGVISANANSTITLTDTNLINNRVGGYGGAIYARTYSNINIINSNLTNNYAGSYGGAIFANRTSITLINSNIIKNYISTTRGFGGAIYGSGNITIIRSNFTNNTAYFGGAIYKYGTLTVTNSSFISNNASSGGAIYGYSGNIIISNSSFISNNASSGGVLYTYTSGSLTVTNSTFTSNYASSGAAIYVSTRGSIIVTNSTFTSNYATYNGVIYATGVLTVKNSSFTSNSASSGGAIYGDYQSTISVENTNFTNNKAFGTEYYNGGGAIYSYYMSVTNCMFSNNQAFYGGAIYAEYRNIIIMNSTIINNNATDGGAIYLHWGCYLTITNSNLTNNNVSTAGGAIYGYTNNIITVTNSNITNNNAEQGGAIYLLEWGNISVTDTSITNNNASSYGGAIYLHGSYNLTVTNTNITNNSVASYGGAIYANTYNNILLTNTNITNNTANIGGGAVYAYSANNISVTDTSITNNNASSYGGAIYARNETNMILTNINLTDNYAGSGGAIYLFSGNISVTDTSITNNNASSYGGAIYTHTYSNLIVTNTNLTCNYAGSGGAIYGGSYSTITVTNSNLTYNTANYGGAIYANTYNNISLTDTNITKNNVNIGGAVIYANSYNNIIVINTNISNNNASSYGGAIYTRTEGNLTVSDANIINNYAGSGGAIYAYSSNITITGTNITNNTVTSYGGAIYTHTYTNITITNAKINNNNASNGGAIYGSTNSNITVTNTNISNNNASNGGAIYIRGNLTVTISNLTNNTANSGGAIYTNTGNLTLKFSNIMDNYVTNNTNYVVDFRSANSIIITGNTFINNTDNVRDMLFSNAKKDAEVDIHSNNYIDNILEDTIIKFNVIDVTDNEDKLHNYYVDLKLREIYNDTVHNGTLNVYVNGVLSDTTEVVDGRSRILFRNNDLTKRENNITLEYISLSKDYQNTTTNLTIKKEVNTTLSIQAPSNMFAGDIAVINFTLVDVNNTPLSGETIHVLVDEQQVASITTNEDGLANYTYNAFGDELVRIEATHHTNSDSFYLSAKDAVAEVDVNKIEPEIFITLKNIVPQVENNITISLFDADGNSIGNKTLTVNITEEGKSDITGTVTTDENGIAVFNFTPVDEGTLNINVTSPSDDVYHYASESVQASKNFITTNMIVTANSMKINQTNTITVEVWADDGALIRGTAQLDIDGEIHTININNGRGTYHDYKSDTAGEKLVSVKFTSKLPGYANVTTTEEFNVEKLPTRVTIEAVNRTAGNVTLKVKVFPEDNIASTVDGGNIVIESIEGENKKVIYNNTLQNGELIYLTDVNETGWYEFETEYYGNDYFLGEVNNTGSIEVTLIELKTIVTITNNTVGNVTIDVQVIDSIINKPIPDVPVVITLTNGTNVTGVTNENGTAVIQVDLPVGDNNITISYLGDGNYEGQGENINVKVKSYSVVTVDAVEGIALDNVTFTAKVVDYKGNKVNGGYVVFKVGGKTLTDLKGNQIRTPVENGIAKLSYQSESGWIVDSHPNLKVQATYSGTSIASSNRSDTSKVTIYKRNATVQVSAPDDYVNGTLHINAIVKDQNGNFVNDGNIVFKLNGLSVKDENNNGIIAQVTNGKVQVDVKLPFVYSAKTYNLTAIYSNKIYNKASGSNTTTLKAIPTYVNATVTIKDEFSKPVVTGQIYNKFNNAILEGTAILNIKFDGISYAKKIKVNNGTFNETLEGISIYKPGTHTVEIAAGANSHYEAVRKIITTETTPKYDVTPEFTNITRNKTTTRVQAKIVDTKNKNVQKDLKITIKLNGKSFLVNKTVTNGNVDVLIDTSSLSNRNYTLELVSGANTYYNAGKATTELPKY